MEIEHMNTRLLTQSVSG